jgi:hypothetical protein
MSLQFIHTKSEVNIAQDDAISLPLYVSGLIVSILGILAVNSDFSDPEFGSTTIVLTVLGFVFSIGCRWLQVKPRIVEAFICLVCLILLFQFYRHAISLSLFIPPDATQDDLIMAVVLEWLTVVRAWVLLTDESVMFTSVTSIAMIGLVGSANMNVDFLIYFFAYAACAIFMLLHQTYLTQRSWSTFSTVKGADRGIVTLQVTVAVFSAIAALLAAAVLVVPLRAVGSHLSLASALKNFIGEQHESGPASDGQPTVSLSDDQNFSVGTGSGLSSSDTVVLRVVPSDHNEHYYIGRTYDEYTGDGWASTVQFEQQSLSVSNLPVDNADAILTPDRYDLLSSGNVGTDSSEPGFASLGGNRQFTAQFSLWSSQTDTLYLPYGTVEVDVQHVPNVSFLQSSDNCIAVNPAVDSPFHYNAVVDDPEVTPTALRTAKSVANYCPKSIRLVDIDQRGADIVPFADRELLNNAAQGIVRSLPLGQRTDFDKAEAIRQWVSQRCRYSLNITPVPSGDDAVSYFLFQSRVGYCDLFASSMAILCRYAGLPARVATGFDPGVANDEGGFDLRAMDKHAWVQVWFNGYGWQNFDPTEGSIEGTGGTGSHFNFIWLQNILGYLRLFFDIHGVLPTVIGIIIFAGLFYIFKMEVYDKRLRNNGKVGLKRSHRFFVEAKRRSTAEAVQYSRSAALQRYQQFESVVKLAGLTRLPSQTPAEFLDSFRRVLAPFPTADSLGVDLVFDSASRLTDDAMLASYAPAELVGEELMEREESGSGDAALAIINKFASAMRTTIKAGRDKVQA